MTVTQKKRKNFRGKLELKDVGIRYHCNGCQRDITDIVRIRCAECVDFDFCVECFSAGFELPPHEKTHSYRVFKPFSFPIFTADWGADEELLLLEGIETLGVGNWQDVADHVGTKSKFECEKHYVEVYLRSETGFIPDLTIEFSKDDEKAILDKRKRLNLPIKNRNEDLEKPQPSQPANHEIAGFMPGRREFETDFDNDAELAVKDIQFSEDDPKLEVDVKLAMLDIYNKKLDRRDERKLFLFSRDLVDFKKQQSLEKRRSKDEKEFYNKMRVYSRYMTLKDFDTFMDGLLFEQKLRRRIAQLQEWRRMGVTSVSGGEIYEQAKQKRETDILLRKNRESTYVYGDKSSTGSNIAPLRHMIDPTNMPRVSTSNLSTKPGRKPAMPLDISTSESVELLNTRERELCSQQRLLPKQYLSMKEMFIAEYNKLGSLKRAQARQLVKMDVNKISRVYDYMISAGWIKQSTSDALAQS